MPYEIIGKVGLPTGILIVMSVLIYEWVKSNKMMHEDHKQFVNSIVLKCDDRECKLIQHIEKQDENMNRITSTLDRMDHKISNIDTRMGSIENRIK